MEITAHLVLLCFVLATVEMLHGIVSVRVVVPWLGRLHAQRLSIVTGSLLAFSVCWFIIPSLGISEISGLLAIGCVLAVFMASFDIAVTRFLMHRPWRTIHHEFDPRRGNYLVFGLLFLVVAPVIVMTFHVQPWVSVGQEKTERASGKRGYDVITGKERRSSRKSETH